MYRLTYGSKIVKSFYDFDTHKIGPYTCPININFNEEDQKNNSIPLRKFYQLFREQEDALAVINNANYCFVVLHTNYVTFEPIDSYDIKTKEQLPVYDYHKNLTVDTYKHVGFIKTYQECKAVYQWPWYLVQSVTTGEVPYIKDKILGEPLVNPPLSLYKELINTDYNAVYFDLAQNKPVFLN